MRPTKREAHAGYAPRFLGICLALGFFPFDGESTLRPVATNADSCASYYLPFRKANRNEN